MIRVLEFADVINRFDFIDTIVNYADPAEFEMSVCVRTERHEILSPEYSGSVKYRLLPGNSRRDLIPTAWRLSRLLKDWRIDILHAHHFDQAVIGWIATKLSPNTKLVLGRHYSNSIYRNKDKIKRKILLALENLVNRHAERIIVPSKMIAHILSDKQKVSRSKIDVVHYGFVPEKYLPALTSDASSKRTEFGMEGRFVVGNFSRLHEEKGHRYLLEAIAKIRHKIPNLLVLIVGEGPERASMERQIDELGIRDNVQMLGWRRDAMAIMSAVDVVAQSTLQEAFSQVMCEAMWLGKPLIITDVSGACDIIDDGSNGLMIPQADSAALADAMVRVAMDEDLRKRLGETGRAFVNANLTIDRIIRLYEDSFRKAAVGM